MHKIFKILAYVLAVIAIILTAMIASGNEGQVGSILFVAYIVLAIVLAAVVIFTLVNTFANPANLKRTLINLGAFLLLAVICYAMATGTETDLKDGGTLSAGASKMVGAGLYLFYFLIIIAAGTMLFSGIKKMIK
ncbi:MULTISPECIES: hypothetical protein [Hyunsoonleella]|uniref:Uncharacterized protein n=2 Tax=Hyunsoonleella TaxID=1080193 RepID=A0A923HC03_9FLAO|nr:hypothetical protein [Hyunsoonleella aquatilis]MBC3758321.1 hypothetical protein [Hyunsoonleella aquatilis]